MTTTIKKYEGPLFGVALRETPDAVQRWVTHCYNTKAAQERYEYCGGFYWGHYHDSWSEAVTDFNERAAGIRKSLESQRAECERKDAAR